MTPVHAKACKIDGRQRSKKSVIARIARELNFPDHFGGNLDALYDCLTTAVEGPIAITWRATNGARSAIGDDFEPLVATLKDAQKARDDLDFSLQAEN